MAKMNEAHGLQREVDRRLRDIGMDIASDVGHPKEERHPEEVHQLVECDLAWFEMVYFGPMTVISRSCCTIEFADY